MHMVIHGKNVNPKVHRCRAGVQLAIGITEAPPDAGHQLMKRGLQVVGHVVRAGAHVAVLV
eukprot:104851-Pelagomonas_calceolata.AAC.4